MIIMGRRNVYFEGEGEGEGETNEETSTPTSTPTPTPTPKTFTQEDVNRFLADEKRKAQKANERTIKELETLKKNSALTEEEKGRLEDRVETLRNEFLSKEELAKKEAAKERNKTKQELETKEKESNKWKGLYEETVTQTGLLTAASSDPDIFNPQQIVDLLQPRTRLVEELDSESGNPTGRYTPKVRFAGKDKDGKDIVLELAPTEAVKQMKEMPDKYGNLFKNGATGGLGSNNVHKGPRGNEPPTDPVAFREWRKKNPNYIQKQ